MLVATRETFDPANLKLPGMVMKAYSGELTEETGAVCDTKAT